MMTFTVADTLEVDVYEPGPAAAYVVTSLTGRYIGTTTDPADAVAAAVRHYGGVQAVDADGQAVDDAGRMWRAVRDARELEAVR